MPDVVRHGQDILCSWPDHGVTFELARIRETDAGIIWAEITVETKLPQALGRCYGPARIALNQGGQDRKNAIETLAKRLPEVGEWSSLIDATCALTIERYREIEPLADLADTVAPISTEWLFPDLIPRGETTLIVADRETGKSVIALALGASVASGTPYLVDAVPTTRGPVVIYDWETDQAPTYRRLVRLTNGIRLIAPPQNVLYRRMTGRLLSRVRLMQAEISKLGAVLVIIDSLGWASGGDLNSAEVAIQTMDAIRSLGCTVIVLAHIAKASRENGAQTSAFGSAFFEAGPRCVWEMKANEGRDAIALISKKWNDGDRLPPRAYRFERDPERNALGFSRLDFERDPEFASRLPLHQQVRQAMTDGRSHSLIEIAEKIAAETGQAPNINSLRATVTRMRDVQTTIGQATKTQTQRYILNPTHATPIGHDFVSRPYDTRNVSDVSDVSEPKEAPIENDPPDVMNLPF